jgi:hypothetical protein
LKYLIIAALVSGAFVIIYSRVRPYLKLMRKMVDTLNSVADNPVTTASTQRTASKNKLVRCDSCGTWIPAERALHLGSGLASFCSPECVTKSSQPKQQKLAG